MKYISKAPLRIGLAGGGTDVSPYSDNYGGYILNTTISLYATVVIIPRDDNRIIIDARNMGVKMEMDAKEVLDDIPELRLQIGVYNRIVKDYTKKAFGFEMITTMDAPTGSGLGTSSTMVVAILGAFVEWFNLPLGEYDMAKLAVEIERGDLKMVGGLQDQYAATFGGFNFMEFYGNNRVVVNPLRIKPDVIQELEHHLLLFYTQTKRESSNIIEVQQQNFRNEQEDVINASHLLKEQARLMKEAVLTGNLNKIGELLQMGWDSKKQLAKGISDSTIENIYTTAINAGANGGKISGAGGGGFVIFYCPKNSKFDVIEALAKINVIHQPYAFQKKGLETWTSHQ